MRISIIGAGPSGCIAAASALDDGNSATVYEEHKKIGVPEQCGGLLSRKAMDWFKDIMGVDCRKAILNQVSGMDIFCGKTRITVKGESPKAFVVRRSIFDQKCAELAEKKGARMILGKKLSIARIRAMSSAPIIGADGPFSTVAKTFSFPRIEDYAIAYQYDISGLDLSRSDRKTVQVHIRDKSFGWVIPLDEERAHAGMLFFRNSEFRKFKWFIDDMKSRLGGKDLKTENFFSDCVPFSVRPRVQKGTVYLVGDAAGQVKSTSGGGIYYGCRSAWLAGKTIGSGDYEKKWKKELGGKLHQHHIVRKTMDSLDSRMLEKVINISSMLGLENTLSKYDMEEISSLARL